MYLCLSLYQIALQWNRMPLHHASLHGHTAILQLLLNVPDIDVNKADGVIILFPSLPHAVVVYEWIVCVVIYLTLT